MGGIIVLCLLTEGVIITDNVWFYSSAYYQTTVLSTGDFVEIVDQEGDMVFVAMDSLKGRIHKGVIVDLESEIAPEQLFVFARGYFDNHEYHHAIVLFDVLLEHFTGSSYLPEALYYCGLAHEEMAKIPSWADSIPGLIFNEGYSIWYYPGEEYMTLLERYPENDLASKAAYRLINIFRMSQLPWGDSIKPILDELDMWTEFVERYQNTDELVIALLEVGYLNRVVYEITDDSDYRMEAARIFREVENMCPMTIYAAQARVNLFELARGEKIYKY